MAAEPTKRWKFSLRTLLVVMLLCAVAIVGFKLLGPGRGAWAVLLLLTGAASWILRGNLRRAFFVAMGAVYLPFAAMAAYMNAFVACSHCKQTSLAILPFAPGIGPWELGRRWLDINVASEVGYNVASMLLSVVTVSGLTWFVWSRNRWLGALAVVVSLGFFSFCAYAIKAAIQA